MGVSPVIIQSWMTMTLYRNNLGDDWGSTVKPFYVGPQLVRRVRQADFAPAGGTPATITQSDGQRLLKAREGSSSAEGMAKNLRWDMDGYGIFMGFINKSEDHWSFKVLQPPFMARWGPAAMSPARSRARRPGVAGLWSAMLLSFCRWCHGLVAGLETVPLELLAEQGQHPKIAWTSHHLRKNWLKGGRNHFDSVRFEAYGCFLNDLEALTQEIWQNVDVSANDRQWLHRLMVYFFYRQLL